LTTFLKTVDTALRGAAYSHRRMSLKSEIWDRQPVSFFRF
jgi:hypothetical protein